MLNADVRSDSHHIPFSKISSTLSALPALPRALASPVAIFLKAYEIPSISLVLFAFSSASSKMCSYGFPAFASSVATSLKADARLHSSLILLAVFNAFSTSPAFTSSDVIPSKASERYTSSLILFAISNAFSNSPASASSVAIPLNADERCCSSNSFFVIFNASSKICS